MKAYIRKHIARGLDEEQIEDALVADSSGPACSASRGKHGFDLLAWLLPFAGIAVGAVGARRRRVGVVAQPRGPGAPAAPAGRRSTPSSSAASTKSSPASMPDRWLRSSRSRSSPGCSR